MKRVSINVFNNEYSIKTDAEDEYVHKIAKYLEDQMKEVTNENISLVIPRPVLLATLKIADEYFRLRQEFEEYKSRAEEKSKELVELLDNTLQSDESDSNVVQGGNKFNQE